MKIIIQFLLTKLFIEDPREEECYLKKTEDNDIETEREYSKEK